MSSAPKQPQAAAAADEDEDEDVDASSSSSSSSITRASSIPELWQVLDRELRVNIGTSVKCGICLCTVVKPMRTPCVHSFCQGCILASLHQSQKCPECNTKINKRSLQPYAYLERLAENYKQQLGEFGLIPSTYTPHFTTLTQKAAPPTLLSSQDNDDDEDDDDTNQPQRCLDRWLVASTWQQHCSFGGSKLQSEENALVVQANQKAACQLGYCLPDTQEIQEQAREQQGADYQDWSQQQQQQQQQQKTQSDYGTPREFESESTSRFFLDETSLLPPTRKRVSFPGEEEEDDDDEPEQQRPPPPPSSPFATSFLSPIIRQEESQPEIMVVVASSSNAAAKEETTNTSYNVVTAGLLEDSFGALHWTNPNNDDDDRPPTQEDDDDDDDDGSLTQLDGDDGDHPRSLFLSPPSAAVRHDNNNNNNNDAAPQDPNGGDNSTTTPLSLSLAAKKKMEEHDNHHHHHHQVPTTSTETMDDEKVVGMAADDHPGHNGTHDDCLAPALDDDDNDDDNEEDSYDEDKTQPILTDMTTTPTSVSNHSPVLLLSLPSSKKKNITQRRGHGRGRRGGTTAQVVGPTILEEDEDEDKDDDYSTEEQPQELSRRLNDAGPSSSPTFTPMKEEQDNKATDDPNNNTIIESSSWENKKTPPASATAQPPSSPPPQSEHATSLSSSEEINVDVKNDNNQGGTTTSNEETSTDQENNNNWSIGDIVFVKSRTWPGVNKPGGVARITKCHPEDRTYNVCYILGGRESKVDAIFIQTHSDKKQKRASTELPKSLLQELEAQGFDTTGKAVVTMVEEPKQPPPTLKDSTNRNQKTAATAVGTSGRKRKSAEKEQRTTSKVTTTNQKRKSVNAKATTTSTTSNANRKRKSSEKEDKGSKSDHTKTSNKRKNFPKNPHTAAPPKLALPVLSDEEACQRADTRYQELFQAALKGKVINIVASNLTDRDMDVLKALCSKSLSGDVKFRLSDSFVKKTTLCIVPMDKDADGNLTPRVRTLKTMRSVLAGIPIVPPDWIHACGQTNTAVVPLAYYARSLPTKTDAIRESGDGNFGVAKLAALLDGSKKSQQALPLYDACVFLCGNFPQNKRTDIQRLCKEAGANVLTCPSAVTAKLATKHQPVVLVCHDSSTGTVVPRALEKEIKDDASPLVMVVNMNWVFDSITCARTLPADAFEPTNPKAKVLWRSLVDTTK